MSKLLTYEKLISVFEAQMENMEEKIKKSRSLEANTALCCILDTLEDLTIELKKVTGESPTEFHNHCAVCPIPDGVRCGHCHKPDAKF